MTKKPNGKIRFVEIKTRDLQDHQFNEIWALYSQLHDRSREEFRKSLLDKEKLVLFKDRGDNSLQGMAAKAIYRRKRNGRQYTLFFVGSTFLSPHYRKKNIIQKFTIFSFLKEFIWHPLTKYYVLVPSMSYRSYLVLTRNFREIWPDPQRKTPEPEQSFIDEFGETLFGDHWDAEKGIVYGFGTKRVKSQKTEISEEMKAHRDIHFYLMRNPGVHEGDCLLCLVPLHFKNWVSFGMNLIRRMIRTKNNRLRESRQESSTKP